MMKNPTGSFDQVLSSPPLRLPACPPPRMPAPDGNRRYGKNEHLTGKKSIPCVVPIRAAGREMKNTRRSRHVGREIEIFISSLKSLKDDEDDEEAACLQSVTLLRLHSFSDLER